MKFKNSAVLLSVMFVITMLGITLAMSSNTELGPSYLASLIVHPELLVISVIIVLGQTLTDGIVGYTSLAATDRQHIPKRAIIAITLLSNTAGISMPGPAKTPARVYLQNKLVNIPYNVSILGLTIETIFAYAVLLPTTILTTLIWLPKHIETDWSKISVHWWLIALACILTIILIVLILVKKMNIKTKIHALGTFFRSNSAYPTVWKNILYTLVFTIVIYALGVLRLASVSEALGGDLSFGLYTSIFMLSRIAGIASMMPMGLGARDASLVGLFVFVDIPLDLSIAIAAIERLLLIAPHFLTGPIAIKYLKNYKPSKKVT
ncbi:MAG: flippase-like domain-containing protein [Pseudomonadales bacterium]|nr:flippase-like domain-containing protein [Pseudomonadales bacterium]